MEFLTYALLLVGLLSGYCKGKCTGGDSCCSASNKCGPMEGDCDNDVDCKDGYACGTDNCPKLASFEDADDCCVKAVKKSGSQWKGKLGEGEGDCDPGWCKKGLICGVNNCRYMWRGKPEQSLFASNDDCCFSRSEPTLFSDDIILDIAIYEMNVQNKGWSGEGFLDSAGPYEFCGGKESLVKHGKDIGSAGYATKFSLKIEGKQLLGDDTAANALCLYCSGGDYICSKIGKYGSWYYSSECSDGFTDAKVKNYPPKWYRYPSGEVNVGRPKPKDSNGVDDTAISNVQLKCGKRGENKWLSTNGPDLWGNWIWKSELWNACKSGSVLCGIRAMVEDDGDDLTGLQGFSLICCAKEALVCEPYEQHACYLAAIKNGLKHGSGEYEFASEDYGTPGCYTYTSGSYKGVAFFGQRGSTAEKKASLSGSKARVPGFDCKDLKVNNPFFN